MLFGRVAECSRFDRALEVARQGRSAVVVLTGDAGLGKTSLLTYAVENAPDMTVLQACGVESESALPFAGLHELLHPLLDRLDTLAAPRAAALRGALALASGNGDVQPFATYLAALDLLAAAAEERPVLCVVDDAQWLDGDSAAALAFVARRLDADAVTLLLAMRPGGGFAASGIERLELGPLPPADALALLRAQVSGAVASEVAERLVRHAGGNPLALLDSARGLTDGQRTGREAIEELLLPAPSTDARFRRRVEDLDPQTRRMLLVAAVADGDAAVVLRTAQALDGGTAALERAEEAGLLLLAGGRATFSHPMLRSAAYGTASPRERRDVHHVIAAVVGEPMRTWHLALAAFGPDEAIARRLEDHALGARRRGGAAGAADALERAALLSVDPGDSARRRFHAADAARLAGQSTRAIALLEAAMADAEHPALQVEILHARGRLELLHGRTGAAERLLSDGVARFGVDDPDRAARMLADAAFAAMLAEDDGAAVAIARRARGLAARTPPDAVSGWVTDLVLGTALFRSGRVDDGLRLVLDAAERAERALEDGLEPEVAVHVAHGLAWVGEFRRARRLLRRIEADVRDSGALGVLPWVLYATADLGVRTGDWAAASAAAWEAARVADETGNPFLRAYALGCLATVDAGQGREDDCRSRAAEAATIARRLGVECPRKVTDALGLLELGLGRPAEAVRHFGRTRSATTRQSIADLVEAHVRAQIAVPDEVRAVLQTLSTRGPALRALVQRCEGLMAGDDAFEAPFRSALEAYDETEMPFSRARTALLLGERLRRHGQRVDARPHLRAALESFTALEARPWIDRAAQELKATGERVPRMVQGAAEELTGQERQVALVVAGGATNREAGAKLFLSPKTIEYHLAHVFRKLGVRSRTELAARLNGAATATTTSRRPPA